ncbi:MAG: glutathione transporter permease [Verrucomicrobiales bacterium]|nr:glutathione transporter permease [Verrucomicrobiales bacterium]
MLKRLCIRLVWSLLVLIGAAGLSFLIARAVPGDPARVIAGAKADAETIALIRTELHLNDPLWKQFGRYLWQLGHGDLGKSYVTNQPVTEAILTRFPATAALSLTALVIWMALAIPVGVLTARYQGTYFDRIVLVIATIGISLPALWVARLLQYELAYKAGLFPVAGLQSFRHLLLPALTLVVLVGGYYARLIHTNMVEVLRMSFIRTAEAKGVSGSRLLFVHALRNALIPVVTILGIDLAGLLGGVVFTENVFALPGIGTLALQSVFNLDAPIIMGTVIFSAFLVVSANLVVDLLYNFIDPRIRG